MNKLSEQRRELELCSVAARACALQFCSGSGDQPGPERQAASRQLEIDWEGQCLQAR